ncbi:FAD-binding oxidoreductase [Microbaculum sp. FT89]|uniref:FAD-binding oxidoreductase n=1 Tax=Microbaculum sp. FT89 TaxID=3447298 RepID=UPI003F52E4B0
MGATHSERCGELLSMLSGRLSAGTVVAGPDVGPQYARDATATPGLRPELVLRPGTAEEVAAILKACDELRQPVVVQGGRTGLAGAARPLAGEVALSLERLTRIEPPDPDAMSIVAEAGATMQGVQDAADTAGLYFGVDIGARGTATVGGNLATNAGGIRVLRYGMYRAQLLGLEAVLADGAILGSMRGLQKDNTGYDLGQLLVGSEGTLGVITRACLRLFPKPETATNAFCAAVSVDAAITLLHRLRQRLGPFLSAYEVILGDLYGPVSEILGAAAPMPATAPIYVLAEMQGNNPDGDRDLFQDALMAAVEEGLLCDVVVSQSGRDYAGLWGVRETCSEFLFALGGASGFDVSVPVRRMTAFLDAAGVALARVDPQAQAYVFGHLGDGNLHYIVRTDRHGPVADTVLSCTAAHGGSVSAEHGIGIDKRPWLRLVRSEAEIDAMRRIKRALDPNLILNRGRVFETLLSA